jgi:hypothetical protein
MVCDDSPPLTRAATDTRTAFRFRFPGFEALRGDFFDDAIEVLSIVVDLVNNTPSRLARPGTGTVTGVSQG